MFWGKTKRVYSDNAAYLFTNHKGLFWVLKSRFAIQSEKKKQLILSSKTSVLFEYVEVILCLKALILFENAKHHRSTCHCIWKFIFSAWLLQNWEFEERIEHYSSSCLQCIALWVEYSWDLMFLKINWIKYEWI